MGVGWGADGIDELPQFRFTLEPDSVVDEPPLMLAFASVPHCIAPPA